MKERSAPQSYIPGKPHSRLALWLIVAMACACLCIMAACGRGTFARLALINDLMEEHPDSALALINGIDTVVAF